MLLKFLETNSFNILILNSLLFYFFKRPLISVLKTNQNEIFLSFKNLKKNFIEIKTYSSFLQHEILKNFYTLTVLKKNTEKEKIDSLNDLSSISKKIINNFFIQTEILIKNFENLLFYQLQIYVFYLILSKIISKFLNLSEKEKSKFIQYILTTLEN